MTKRPLAWCAVAIAVLATSACGGARFENTPLAAGQSNPERRSIAPAVADRPVILMTFSGGGTRAAALSAAVLGEMAATTYAAADATLPLTADIKLISSVSGGSVTAAWFGLNVGAAHPDGDLAALRDRFLTYDNMRRLELEGANPITWLRLAFTGFTRIEALEDAFDDELFQKRKMSELDQPGKPFIILNTTDMAGGESFGLTPRRFDDICSSYDALPIATGVAASAAFPVLLSPVSFRNYSPGCAGARRNDEWATIDLANPYTPHLNLEEYREARYANDLRRGANPFRTIDNLYFLDGGVADNIGFGSLRTAMVAPYDDAAILRAINQGQITRLVVIVVNARSDPNNGIYQQQTAPGMLGALAAVTSVPIDANTANAQLALSGLLDEFAKAAQQVPASAKFKGMKVYGVTVDFDQIPSDTPADRDLRDQAKDIPTLWTLTPAQLAVLDKVGPMLLRADPCYQLLVADLKASQPPGPATPLAAACATKIEVPPK